MERKDPQDRKEAEAWTATKAPMGPEDPRGNQAIRVPQDHPPTRLILPWLKVPEVTQDSQELTGSQEAGESQETPGPQAPVACPLEMKMRREASRGRWDPKASRENQASPHSTPAHLELMEGQVSQESLGLPDHLDPTVSCLVLKEQKDVWATLGLPVSQELEGRKDGKVTPGTADVQKAISSSGDSRDCQDPKASRVSMGNQAGKGTKETLDSMASLGSQGSRESLASSVFLGPRELKGIPGR